MKLRFFVFIAALYAGVFTLSRLNQQRFDPNLLETMITQTSRYQDRPTDPCFYDLAGDPNSAGQEYAKVKLVCSDVKQTVISLDLRAVKGTHWSDFLAEVAHINNFDIKQIADYRCFVEKVEIKDLTLPIIPRAILNCFQKNLTTKINDYLASWPN